MCIFIHLRNNYLSNCEDNGIFDRICNMDTILFFQRLNTNPGRQRLEGLSAFAHEVGWNIQCQSDPLDAGAIARLSEFWKPKGAILGTNDGVHEYDPSLFSPDTTVLQDCFPRKGMEKYAVVTTDSAVATEMAMRELLSAKRRAYGFVPWPEKRLWSENRRIQFRRIGETNGIDTREFVPESAYSNVGDMQKDIVKWLGTLPRPIGLLAANDVIAMHVLNACLAAGLSVPFDCAVVSISDDEALCEGTTPTLTSVSLNFRDAGYRAGEILYGMIAGKSDERPIIAIPPTGIFRRGSSKTFLLTDRLVQDASELIQKKACEGLKARDVLAMFPCSRRLAEIRFRKATGHSVLEEIRAARIEKAKHLLGNPNRDLAAVASLCGCESDTTFRRFFKQETGMTMREWRDGRRRGGNAAR